MRIIIAEGEAGTGILVFIVGNYGILQTAGLTDDRNCAVAQCDQRLRPQGSKSDGIRNASPGCVDLVRERLRVEKIRGNLARILLCEVLEHLLVAPLTGAENHSEIHGHKFLQNALNQIKSLLICHAGDNADHHHMRINRKAKLFLQLGLVLLFLLPEVGDGEVLVECRIIRRIELIVIDARSGCRRNCSSGPKEVYPASPRRKES